MIKIELVGNGWLVTHDGIYDIVNENLEIIERSFKEYRNVFITREDLFKYLDTIISTNDKVN